MFGDFSAMFDVTINDQGEEFDHFSSALQIKPSQQLTLISVMLALPGAKVTRMRCNNPENVQFNIINQEVAIRHDIMIYILILIKLHISRFSSYLLLHKIYQLLH